MKLKKILPFLLGGALVIAAAAPIAGVAVSCSSSDTQSSTSSSNAITDSFKQGGSASSDGLSTNAFKDIANALDLNKDTTLSELTNEDLNQRLVKANNEFSGLKLTIKEGSSELTGELKLNINGQYKDKTYNDDFVIKNFNSLGRSKDFTVSGLQLDISEYLRKCQPFLGSSGIKLLDFDVAQLSTANFKIGSKTLTLADVLKVANVEGSWSLSSDQTKIKLTLTLTSKRNNEYNGTSWISADNNKLIQTNEATIDLPSAQIVFDGFLDNIVPINNSDVKKYLPSKYLGEVKYKIDHNENLTEMFKDDNWFNSNSLGFDFELVIAQYSGDSFTFTKKGFSTDINDYKADDTNGTFSLKYELDAIGKLDNKPYHAEKTFVFDGLKTIASTDVPKDSPLKLDIHAGVIIADSEANGASTNLYNAIGKEFKDELQKIFVEGKVIEGKSIDASSDDAKKIINAMKNLWNDGTIYNKDNTLSDNIEAMKNFRNKFTVLNAKEVEFGHFRANVSDGKKFDYDTGLFNFDGKDTIFLIDSIVIDLNTFNTGMLSFEGQSIKLTFQLNVNINFNGQTIIQPTRFDINFDE